MTLREEPLQTDNQKKRQIYLQRVNHLYHQIQDWLQNDGLVITRREVEITEALGQYWVPLLTIQTDVHETLAEFKPVAAEALHAEGMIEVSGWLDSDYIMYMRAGGPGYLDPAGVKHPFYPGIEAEGWYWLKDRVKTDPLFLNQKFPLLQLITLVSDHEF
jgi:hypothetical protein